jgi:spermidine/putrescine transport system substrate-binding protein
MFLMGAAGLAGCARGRPRLNVYNWSNYVAPDTIANFEAEFGVRVRYATYESNEEMLAKVLGGNSGWDVVFPTHNRIPPMRQYGLLAPLDHARLPNLPNLEPRFQSPPWDPRLEYCVPYMWGATGIAYSQSVAPAPAAWADLWSARFNLKTAVGRAP